MRRAAEEPEGLGRDDPQADPVVAAREIVLRQLTVRARTRSELEAILRRKGVPDDAATEVLDRFGELRLVDDAGFATGWVESGQRRLKSRRVLRQELATKGVDVDLANEALAQVDDEQEYAAALALARKKTAATRGLEAPVRYRRIAGALARRGFSGGVTHRAVREALVDAEARAGDTGEGEATPHG